MNIPIGTENEANTKPAKRSRARFIILTLLFFGTAINYLDRTNIAVAAPYMKEDLHLSPEMLGLIFSGFSWAYVAMQIPGGWLLDRFGSRVVYGIGVISWSLFTILQGFVKGAGLLFGLRLAVGMSEAPAFPSNSRVVASWFPRHERGLATGTFTAGEYIGLALVTPLFFLLISLFGWHSVFIVMGVIGIVFGVIWFKVYRDPKNSKYINREEMDYIRQGGALVDNTEKSSKFKWSNMKHLLSHRQLWGMYIGEFANGSILYFFLTWFPTYLMEGKDMGILKVGIYASIPYLAAFIGVLFSGHWSDRMLKRGKSPSFARKTPIITGLLLASTMVLANYTTSVGLTITIMSVAFFAQGMANIAWTLVADMAPKELLGTAGGVFNVFANLGGILTPIVIGLIVGATNSFSGGLVYMSIIGLVGAISYIFLVGKVERIEIPNSDLAKE